MNNTELLKLWRKGLTHSKIGMTVGCSRATISRRLLRLGVTSHQTLERIGSDKAKCSRCKRILPIDRFMTTCNGRYFDTYCRKCKAKKGMDQINARPENYLKYLLRKVVGKCRRKGITCDLTLSYLIELFARQKGRCFYTGVPLRLKLGFGRCKDSCSLDKIINDKGYTQDNVVLCSSHANLMKSDFTLEELKIWLPNFHRKLRGII